jgi:hypothetical protein
MFWPHTPALWFSQADCQFLVRGVTDSFTRYCHVVAALPHESLRLVADLVETPPEDKPYQQLKDRLMASRQLMRYQRAKRLFAMLALGSRKPSEMMAAMLEVCLRGEEKTDLVACLFLQRVPRELRVLLARADHKDPKALADHRDELWAFHMAPAAQLAALAVDGPGDAPIAAVWAAGESSRGSGRDRGGGRGGQQHQAVQEPEASKEARLAAGLCIKHWRYGEQANSCEQPCSWQGNGGARGKLNAVVPGELLHLRDTLSGFFSWWTLVLFFHAFRNTPHCQTWRSCLS